MSARASRVAAFTSSLPLVLAVGCAKPITRVDLADADHQTPSVPAKHTPDLPGEEGRRPHIERMRLTASVSGLGDMLDAAEQVYALWVPPEPGAPPLDAQTFMDVALVQWGFSPTWFSSVELDGLHTLNFEFPHEDQIGVTDADMLIAASIASPNPTALVEGFPPEGRPEPLEQGLWQAVEDDGLRLLFRARPDVLEVATSFELLDSIAGTRQALQSGPRIRASVSNVEDEINEGLRPMLEMQGIDPKRQDEILDALAVELRGDFGRDRDLTASTSVVAPFGEVYAGGSRLDAPSELAKLLPTGALFVMIQSWATPMSLGVFGPPLDSLDLPAQDRRVVEDLLAHTRQLVAQFGEQTALAAYVDRKGRGTTVFLTTASDEVAAKSAARELFAWFASSSAQLGSGIRATVKRDAYRSGKAKTDVLSIELRDSAREVLDGMPWLLGTGSKPTLEFTATVHAGKLVVTLGPGHRDLLATLAPRLAGSSDAGLERGGGLAKARELTDGCQTCVAVDPVAVADGLLAILATHPDSDRAFRKLLDSTRKRLLGLQLDAELSFAARFDAQRWDFALAVPKSLLFLDAATTKQILESFEAVRDEHERIGTPSNEKVCKHVMEVMRREMGDAAVDLSADELAKFMQKCTKDLDKEREKIGEREYRRQAKCVIESSRLDVMMKCEEP